MRVKTGEKKYAGTDANVFAILYGEKDDTGKLEQQHNLNLMKLLPLHVWSWFFVTSWCQWVGIYDQVWVWQRNLELVICLCVFVLAGLIKLKACKHYKNKFEQGMINEFTVEAVDLGELKKLRIGHDNSGVCGLRLTVFSQFGHSFK